MTTFTTPPEHLSPVLDSIDQLYQDEVRPRERALEHRLSNRDLYLDEEGKLHPEVWEARKEIMKVSASAGIYAGYLPTRIGGLGLSRQDMVYVEEKVYGYGVRLNPALLSWSEGATPRLIWDSDDHREQFIDPLVRGELTSCHCVTEPHAGSNVFDFTTNAVEKNGDWVLNGHKAFITNAFNADVMHVFAVTDPGKGRKSFSYFQFLAKDYEGKGLTRGGLYQTMFDDGFTGELIFEDIVLPKSAMLGQRGQGFDIAFSSINWTRMRRGGMCSGWGKFLIDLTVDRAQNRVIGGKALGANQGIQWMISDMYADWYQARATSLAVTATMDNPGPWWTMPRPPEEIREICTMKLVNDEAFYRIADRALQIHGGAGVLKNTDVNKLFQIARNLRIPGGSDEVQRTSIAESFGLKFRPA
ncbi:MAG: acyl-CoA dehydrogenase [Acidimicrobiia bacterium]|nr:acyl-CoA dehydrogenase [Acidimicrobiia bacterium]MDH3462097.1 acyl-CoA dehydrogenase [Acidimicrobiia bacterium]